LTFVSWGCVAFAAVMALIFTFCIGASAGVLGVSETVSIYDYFGKVYEQLETFTKKTPILTLVKAYVPLVLGTVISAGSLISIIVCTIVTVVKSVKNFVHKKEANWTAPAIGAYISFAVFATAFVALNATAIKSSGMKISVNYSPATLAGLILGGIGLGGYYVCKAIVYFAETKSVKAIVKSSVMLGAGVLAIAVSCLFASPVLGIGAKTSGTYSSSTAFGFMEFIQYISKTDSEAVIVGCSIAGVIVQLAALVFAVLTVVFAAKFVSEGKSGAVLPCSIIATVLSAATLALAITAGQLYLKDLASEDYSISFVAPIAALVLSVVALAAVIVAVCLFRKNGNAQEQNQ
ncbi:MAG: hypothetical protein HDR17_14485, partial [Lachnospiraceae bacterium]|nr:hypothetical protein [Lachnospiraceae bacterium]